MKEVDGTPNVPSVREIIMPNGSLSCTGNICSVTFTAASAITGSGTINVIPRWTSTSAMGNATGFNYNATTNPLLVGTAQNAAQGALWVKENGASNTVPVISAAQGVLTVHQVNDGAMWGIVYANDASPNVWGSYVTDLGQLIFQSDSGGFVRLTPAASVLVSPAAAANGINYLISGVSTKFGQIVDQGSDEFSLSVGTTQTAVAGTALKWKQTGVTAFTVALGSDATGDIYYNGGSGVLTRRAIGTTGKLLGVVAGVPDYISPSAIFQPGTAFASLGTPSDGAVIYCTDCDAVADGAAMATCAASGGGTGAFAFRKNGAWKCL